MVRPRVVANSPTVQAHSMVPDQVREAADVKRLAELGPHNTRLLKAEDLLNVTALVPLLRMSIESGVALWMVSATDPVEAAILRSRFGNSAYVLTGSTRAEAVIFGFQPTGVLHQLLNRGDVRPNVFADMDGTCLDWRTLRLLEDRGIPVRRDSWIRRALRHPQFIVYLAVFLYSSLRALPVAFVKEFHGSLVLLWTIDIVTAIPYTWGVLTMLFGKRLSIRLIGAVVTLITFVAPYIYFWMHGRDYPPYVIIVIVILTALTVTIELLKYIDERMLERRYRKQYLPSVD